MKVNVLDELIKNIVLGAATIGTAAGIVYFGINVYPKICDFTLKYLVKEQEERKSSKMERMYSE